MEKKVSIEKKHYEVVAAVITQNFVKNDSVYKKIFCAQRSGPKLGKEINETNYKWEFPGGKIEKGETKEEALKREIFEEFGAKIEVGKFITTVEHEYKNFCITMHAFYCTLQKGILELKEHLESAWIDPSLLTFLKWADADIPIMKIVQQDLLPKSSTCELKKNNTLSDISLRLFSDSDIPQFVSWLNESHVAKWFTNPSSWIEEVSKHNAEFGWITHYIISSFNENVGFCQYYPFELGGETFNGTIPIKGTYSLDYFVGNQKKLRQGITRSVIGLMYSIIKCFSSARRIIVQPEKENYASQKTLISAGFHYDEKNNLYILEWD